MKLLSINSKSSHIHSFRKRLETVLSDEAQNDQEKLTTDDIAMRDRIWNELSESPVFESREKAKIYRFTPKPLFAVVTLAAAVILTVYSWPSNTSQAPQQTLKNSIATAPMIVDTHLRFAVIDSQKNIISGSKGMNVTLGSAIIFSIETSGQNIVHSTITLKAKDPLGRETTLVENYLLDELKEYVRQGDSYIAYTPEELGRHRVLLNFNDDNATEKRGLHEIEFEVVPTKL